MSGPWESYAQSSAGPWVNYAAQPSIGSEAPVTAGGLYKAVNTGAENTVAGLAGLPHTIANLGGQGIQAGVNLVNRTLGRSEDTRDLSKPGMINLPTSEQALATIKQNFNPKGWIGPDIGQESYQPQNRAERLAQTGTEFALNAAVPGGLVGRVASVALPTVATNAVQEAGGGPIAQAAAALVGGIGASKVGRLAENMAATKLPKIADVEAAATSAYKNVENATVGVSFPNRDQFVTDLKDTLNKAAKREANVPDVYAAIDKLPAKADVADLVILQKNLTPLVGREGVAARLAIGKVEQEVDRLAPGAGAQLSQADQDWNAFKTAQGLDKRTSKAELQTASTHSGTNLGNKLRQSAAAAATGPQSRFMRPDEIKALENVARGTFLQNLMRTNANRLGNGVGLGGLAAGALGGEYLGGHEGGAGGALATLMLGRGLGRGYNMAVARQAGRVGQQVLARSPEAARIGAAYRPPQGLLAPFGMGILPATMQLQLPSNKRI
jgi:hypothetical protein